MAPTCQTLSGLVGLKGKQACADEAQSALLRDHRHACKPPRNKQPNASPDGGIAWRNGSMDPDYYWADAATGDIKCTKHCLWEEIK